uniref:Secreted protein n=1 Tax=Micrurus surinamensis TaxID=129470 RepID=A0A2D4NNT8_MICSU
MHFILFLDLISLAPSAIQKCLCQSLWVCFPPWNTLHEKQKQLALASFSPVPICFKEHADVLVVLYSDRFILPFSLTCSHKTCNVASALIPPALEGKGQNLPLPSLLRCRMYFWVPFIFYVNSRVEIN